MEERIIKLDKQKLVLLLLGAIAFVSIGVWLVSGGGLDTYRSLGPLGNKILGFVSIVLFGAVGISIVKKLFDTSPGLIVNASGFVDNSSGVAVGHVPWKDVIHIGEYQMFRQKFVTVKASNPEKYIAFGPGLKRFSNRGNHSMSGTPINISATSLDIGFDELADLLRSYKEASDNI